MTDSNSKPVVFLISTGLGHISRGYESFAKECFWALKDSGSFNLFLFKGAGNNAGKEQKVWCFKRNDKLTRRIGIFFNKEPYWIEQLTFFCGLIHHIVKKKPVLIYYSDFILGTFLWHLRRYFKFKYKLLFSNGAPNGPPFNRTDYIQQLLPLYLEEAIAGGTHRFRQTLLPYGIIFNPEENRRLNNISKREIREKFQLPQNKQIIVSVGAVNKSHKRMDYVIKEFSSLNLDKYYLVILGNLDINSEEILGLAENILPFGSHLIKQVESSIVKEYLLASDYFILASVKEGLPRVLIEALSCGLLPIVHDYNVTRETLLEYGVFRNLFISGQMREAIKEVDERGLNPLFLRQHAEQRFSWDILLAEYNKMIVQLIAGDEI